MTATLILAVLTGLVYPAYFVFTFRRTHQRILSDDRYRMVDYRVTLALFWTLTLAVLVNYVVSGQPALLFIPAFSWLSVGISILVVAFLLLQYRMAVVTSGNYTIIRNKLNDIYPYLPKSSAERNWFMAVSLSAGICEEILFRMFLPAVLQAYMPLALAFLAAGLIFALTHIGSGWKNLLSSLLLGLLFAAIFYFTGNIWIVIVLHAGIDMNTGILGYRVARYEQTVTPSS